MPEELAGRTGPIVGRDAEVARLEALVSRSTRQDRVLVVLGDAGMGKTMLLAAAAGQARSAGRRVLSATGREQEANLAFSGLHQLLLPVLEAVPGLPPRQAQALASVLGLATAPAAADRLVTGIAVLTLLSDVSGPAPVLVVIDDADWLDRPSLEVLAFISSRLEAEQVVLLLAARGPMPPAGFEKDIPQLRLGPLPTADAGRLLDRQPRPPRGQARVQVLAQAAGNPLALAELARVIADDPAIGRRWAAEPLPPGDRLMAVITARLTALPATTRTALLLAAVTDGTGLPGVMAAAAPPDVEVLAAAEQLGLIRIDRAGLRFTHPLIRSAVYHAAPYAQRAAAHRRAADELADQPDRRAWHLAAASPGPDEYVASLLEATADQAQRRGGVTAAAMAMERAAELSPAPRDQARRLVSAAAAAVATARANWVRDLTAQALARAPEPELRLRARSIAGWALAYSGRRPAAFTALVAVAEEASAGHPDLAWEALADAATVAFQAGTAASRQEVGRVLRSLEAQDPAPLSGPGPYAGAAPRKAWILACTDPLGQAGQLVPYLRQQAGAPLDEAALWRTGSAAWLVDESGLAVRMLHDAMDQLRAPGRQGSSGGGLTALGWLYFDTGHWDQALQAAGEAASLAEASQMDMVAAAADVIIATVLALRADSAAARRHGERALSVGGPADNGLIAARARRALGVAALADGDHFLAFTQLRHLFSPDGAPLHNIFSYPGLPDLAAAAVRADRREEGRRIVERALSQLTGAPSPRLRQLIASARGALTDPRSAGELLASELADPAGEQWPFERARLRLGYGEWLRRQRRINEAKPELTLARETFQRLRAQAWVQRAETELRATGVTIARADHVRDPLAELTPQQRQIVRLAAGGLTNREIADQLLLSPRTVSSHLYRSFPKLGVTDRHQLRDVISTARLDGGGWQEVRLFFG